MFTLSLDAVGFQQVCNGVAAVLVALSPLVWAWRRDPKGKSSDDNSNVPRLPDK